MVLPDDGGQSSHGNSHRNQRLRPHRALVRARVAGGGLSRRSRDRRGQRSDRRQDARAPARATTRCTAITRARSIVRRQASSSTARRITVLAEKDPAKIPWSDAQGRHRHRVDGPLHRRRQGQAAHERQRQEGADLGAGQGAGRHARRRHQPRDLRPEEAPHHLQRVVHDQLPRARRQGACTRPSASCTA